MGTVGSARARMRGWRGWRALSVACAVLAALWLALSATRTAPAHATLAFRRDFPRRAPADIAHRLADFSTLPHAKAATPGSWLVEEDRGNFTLWRYRVRWACGEHCIGEAHVAAEARAQAPSHAHALRHIVTLHVRTCTGGLLPWSDTCDEMEISAEVDSDGAEGAVLKERARATCGMGASAGQVSACAAMLRAHRTTHHATLAGTAYV